MGEELKKKYKGEFDDKECETYWRKECRPEWVVDEERKYKEWQEAERAKPKEEQEWYQKWLRRQENKPINWAAEWKHNGEAIDPEEKRQNPEDKEYYTFEELKKKYKGEFD